MGSTQSPFKMFSDKDKSKPNLDYYDLESEFESGSPFCEKMFTDLSETFKLKGPDSERFLMPFTLYMVGLGSMIAIVEVAHNIQAIAAWLKDYRFIISFLPCSCFFLALLVFTGLELGLFCHKDFKLSPLASLLANICFVLSSSLTALWMALESLQVRRRALSITEIMTVVMSLLPFFFTAQLKDQISKAL